MGTTLPKSVISLGGRYVDTPDFKDQGQTPNQLISLFDFGGTLLLFETRGLVSNKNIPGFAEKYPNKVTNELYFERGVVKSGKFFPDGKQEGEPLVQVDFTPPHPGGHFQNFINAVRSRKREELNAEIQEGHLSAALCGARQRIDLGFEIGDLLQRVRHPAPCWRRPRRSPKRADPASARG